MARPGRGVGIATLAVGLTLLGVVRTATAARQDASTVPDTTPDSVAIGYRHHAAIRPDYVGDLVPPRLQPIHIPPPPASRPPDHVRGIYMNAWVFGGARLAGLVALADTTEINTFVIDVKEVNGFLSYRSSVPTAIEIGANARVAVRNPRERLAMLKAHGIHTVARIVVAKDSLLATQKHGWAIRDTSGGIWLDRFGVPWVDAYRDSVWIYAAELAQEAVLLGFGEVQFDYVRLPDEKPERMAAAVFRARRPGESRRSGIRRNLELLRDRLKPMGVPFALDVFGLTTSARGDMGIGQVWEDLVRVADVVLPMVYPSHYYAGAYGFRWPNAEPYGVVRRALSDGLARTAGIPNAATIRPFLQSFSIRRVVYRAPEIRAQIDAVYDLGLTDWILWNASSRYPADAFLPAAPGAVAESPAMRGTIPPER